MLNLNDKKTRNYKTPVALATCVLNREYVITNYTYIIKNSLLIGSQTIVFAIVLTNYARHTVGKFHTLTFSHRILNIPEECIIYQTLKCKLSSEDPSS